jgi:hypothetical protein
MELSHYLGSACHAGDLDEIGDSGAELIINTMLLLIGRNLNPIAAIVRKLDKMNEETPFR